MKLKVLLDLKNKIKKDDIFTGAAALGFYLILSIFPGMIFLLSILPYIPVDGLNELITNYMASVIPVEATHMFSSVVNEVMSKSDTSLVSFGFLATLWAASTGMYALMKQLNLTYEVNESRPYWKGRLVAVFLTMTFGITILSALLLIVFGGVLQNHIQKVFFSQNLFSYLLLVVRWLFIAFFIILNFSLIYKFGPNATHKFKFFSPGSFVGGLLLVLSSLGFRYYVENFANYSRTYGSLGAIIILMFWFYIAGAILLLGSEINAVFIYGYSSKNKDLSRN